MWFISVEVERETSAPPPKKNPGSAPGSLKKFERIGTKGRENVFASAKGKQQK